MSLTWKAGLAGAEYRSTDGRFGISRVYRQGRARWIVTDRERKSTQITTATLAEAKAKADEVATSPPITE
jgi:hypothetical protein